MGWVKQALLELREGRDVEIQPFGGSMRGRIESGQRVTLTPVRQQSDVTVDDVVLVKVKQNYFLHLIHKIEGDQYLIGNNIGGVNGWVGFDALQGKVIRIEPFLTGVFQEWLSAAWQCKVLLADNTVQLASIRKPLARLIHGLYPGDTVQLALSQQGTFSITGVIKRASDDEIAR